MSPGLLSRSGAGNTKRPSCAKTGHQLPLERTTALDVEGLIDRLVADPHGLIIGEIDRQPPRDLLGAPSFDPAAVPTMRLVPPLPPRTLRPNSSAVRRLDQTRKPVLDVIPQPLVGGQSGLLRPSGSPLRVPLRGRRLVLEPPRPGGSVAAHLTRDRRRIPPEPTGDLPKRDLLGTPDSDVLPLREGQISAGHSRGKTRVHAASVTEPPIGDGG